MNITSGRPIFLQRKKYERIKADVNSGNKISEEEVRWGLIFFSYLNAPVSKPYFFPFGMLVFSFQILVQARKRGNVVF